MVRRPGRFRPSSNDDECHQTAAMPEWQARVAVPRSKRLPLGWRKVVEDASRIGREKCPVVCSKPASQAALSRKLWCRIQNCSTGGGRHHEGCRGRKQVEERHRGRTGTRVERVRNDFVGVC